MKKLGFFAMLLCALTFTACDNNDSGELFTDAPVSFTAYDADGNSIQRAETVTVTAGETMPLQLFKEMYVGKIGTVTITVDADASTAIEGEDFTLSVTEVKFRSTKEPETKSCPIEIAASAAGKHFVLQLEYDVPERIHPASGNEFGYKRLTVTVE